MPATPVTWSGPDFLGNTNQAGIQSGPRMTQLTNGNVLICWTDFDQTPLTAGGIAVGTDVVGRIFDPLGNPVSAEIRLNVHFNADDEQDADITALANGGFMVVYEDNDILDDNNLGYDTFDAVGVRTGGGTLLDDAAGGAVPSSPYVASASATSVMTAYIVTEASGDFTITVRGYDPATDVFGAASGPVSLVGGGDEGLGGIGLTALSNDNYALVGANRNRGTDTISIRILDAAGGVLFAATESPSIEIGRVQCVGLTGDNFAIVFEDLTSGAIIGAVYSETGVQVTSSFQISNITGGQVTPAVAALTDGGFVVVWDDNTNSDIRGQRFDNTGVSVGNEFVIDSTGEQTAPSVVGLADGRFQVSWTDDDDIRSEIFDARDAPNSPAVYSPASQIIGTIGNDVITADATLNYGYSGNDTITDGTGANSIYGGDGNDTVFVQGVAPSEFADGGPGIDTLVGSGMPSGTHYNLLIGQLIFGANIQSVLGFQNAIGTNSDEQFTGTAGNNTLEGGAGDDTIDGGAGIDRLVGGADNDSLIVRNGATVIVETAGGGTADAVLATVSYVLAAGSNIEFMQTTSFAGTTAINLTGNALAQEIVGNAGINVLEDGAGAADALRGAGGNDSYVIRTGGTVIVEGVGEGTADVVLAATSFALAADDDIERMQTTSFTGTGAINLTGNALSQTLIGNAGINTLDGGTGVDTLTGSLGNDTYIVRNAATNIDEGAGLGTADRALFAVSYVLAGSDNIEFLQTTSFAGTGAINLTGNAISQVIVGNAGANRIDGKGGNDTINGGAGADVFVFTATLGAGNVDRMQSYDSTLDQIELESSVFTGMIDTNALLAASAFTSNTTGLATAGTHRIIHETDTGFLWFDQDGVAGGAIHFATVDVGVVLTAGEFTVI